MAQQSQSLSYAQYLGFCDGGRRAQTSGSVGEAVTETFLNETAVSVLQLWRLDDCVPAIGASPGGEGEGSRPNV